MSEVMGGDGFFRFQKYVLTYLMKVRSEEIMTSQLPQKTFVKRMRYHMKGA